jgi:hypothetical protein
MLILQMANEKSSDLDMAYCLNSKNTVADKKIKMLQNWQAGHS